MRRSPNENTQETDLLTIRPSPATFAPQYSAKRASAHLTAWKRLISLGEPLSCPSGRHIHAQGELSEDILLLDQGWVKLTYDAPDGRESLVALRFTGQLVDPSNLVPGFPHVASATTLTDCRVYRIKATVVRKAISADPEFALFFAELQAMDFRAYIETLAEQKLLTARERFNRFVELMVAVSEPVACATGVRLRLPMKDADIAALIAVSPRQFVRIKQQVPRCRIHIENGFLVIADTTRLPRGKFIPNIANTFRMKDDKCQRQSGPG